MAQREFIPKHNMVINFDAAAPAADPFRQILSFLTRSRVFHVLTNSPPLYLAYLRQFWNNITYDESAQPPVIRTTVHATALEFSATDLREILSLGTEAQDSGPTEFPATLRSGALRRMGYAGAPDSNRVVKSLLFGQWCYLMHIIITALGAKKAGFDEINVRLFSGMLSLVYNKPYSFSRYFFDAFVEQITGNPRTRFMLFPRFTMMIILHFIPALPPTAEVVHVAVVDRKFFASCLKNDPRRPAELRPQATPLFGHLIDEAYVAPTNDSWEDAVG